MHIYINIHEEYTYILQKRECLVYYLKVWVFLQTIWTLCTNKTWFKFWQDMVFCGYKYFQVASHDRNTTRAALCVAVPAEFGIEVMKGKQRGVCVQTMAPYIYTLSEVPGVRNGGVWRLLLLLSRSREIEVCAALTSCSQESLICFGCCHSYWSSLK